MGQRQFVPNRYPVSKDKLNPPPISMMSFVAESANGMPVARWKPMDVALGDTIHRPFRLVLEAHAPRTWEDEWTYATVSESDGVGSSLDHNLRSAEQWLLWVDRFSDDLTGRELREAKEHVRAGVVEPASWTEFRGRFQATGSPWRVEQPCKLCGNPIVHDGRVWVHIGPKPRHPAQPLIS